MKFTKSNMLVTVCLLVATAGHAAIVDNSGPPMKKPELSDAEKERQMNGPQFIAGGDVPNEPRKNAPGVGSDDDQKSALLDALRGKSADDDAEAALRRASEDVNGSGTSGWLVKGLLGALFAALGFGVVLALRRLSDRALPPPGYPKRSAKSKK